jgi:hypothetical protein
MLLGLIGFEWAWAKVKTLRVIDETRDGKYPPFRRWDAYKWRKWRFYFGAITFMPLRLILSVLILLMNYVFAR